MRAASTVLVLALGCTDLEPLAHRPEPVSAEALGADGRPTDAVDTPYGRASVDSEGTLSLAERVIDRGVLPELALSPSGQIIAYARRRPLGTELWLRPLSDGPARVVSLGLTVVDRPVFGSESAVFAWGSSAQEPLAGLYRLSVSGPPRRLCNVGLRSVDDPRFLDPPIEHRSLRFVDQFTLRWNTPSGPRTLVVSPEEAQR